MRALLSEIVETFRLARLRTFLAAAPGAIAGHLNVVELVRVVLAALAAGGGTWGVFYAISDQASTIFLDPSTAALVSTYLVSVVECLRRLNHDDGTVLGYRNTRARR